MISCFAIRELQIIDIFVSQFVSMKKHNGMRPHDIAILLKIACKEEKSWYMKDLAFELEISLSEISESLNRSKIARLISSDKKSINKLAFVDFLKFGFPYVYPQHPGSIVRGVATAHSAPPLNHDIVSDNLYVWKDGNGDVQGQEIIPLHPNTVNACRKDQKYYELMALTDVLRVGKKREQNMAFDILKERIYNA